MCNLEVEVQLGCTVMAGSFSILRYLLCIEWTHTTCTFSTDIYNPYLCKPVSPLTSPSSSLNHESRSLYVRHRRHSCVSNHAGHSSLNLQHAKPPPASASASASATASRTASASGGHCSFRAAVTVFFQP
ncbi:hypothetical protein VNO78_31457 [Psophocarpus tetragonolobus]|uniref:Uncharacterized protein n=1 Tax=Psophocarpus tetragonolobus TaxID=3891 RepID=A0AAN9RYD4_PSOTE